MKKILYLFSLFLPVFGFSQFSQLADVMFLSVSNQKFILYVDNIQRNSNYSKKVMVFDLTVGNHNYKVKFLNGTIFYGQFSVYPNSLSIFYVENLSENLQPAKIVSYYGSNDYNNDTYPHYDDNDDYQPPRNDGRLKCDTLNNWQFASFLAQLDNQSFEDTKASLVKTYVKNHCLSSFQVRRVLNQFSFSDTKLQLAKYCYDYVADPQNYYQVAEVFSFDTDKQKFYNFLNSKQ